jgi:class 3 adenylate cyclase
MPKYLFLLVFICWVHGFKALQAQSITELEAGLAASSDTAVHCTVMFVDFVGFTKIAEQLSPEVLVEALDHCFSQFDTIIGRYRIEKIKTVGDAYICASGLSDRNDHPTEMIKAALQMQTFLQQFELKHGDQRFQFNARIGIHYGPVVAGIVGTKKFAYDIWGDTVNTAARMEAASSPGQINVSGAVQAVCAE